MFTRVGVPEQILTDCGKIFVSQLLRELHRLLGVQNITTTPYHPATDGFVEKCNEIVKNMIRRTSNYGKASGTLPYHSFLEN